MIAVDTSAVVAIVRMEPEHAKFGALLSDRGSVIGAPSLVEIKMVLSTLLAPAALDHLIGDMISRGSFVPVDFTPEMAEASIVAFRRFGKGQGHPAQLNFGDCMSYAVAKTLRLPLLFKGDDFVHTDIEPALAA